MRIVELRSNPEKNPKVGIIQELERFKDDDDVYVSFTDVNKLGINPRSEYKTPLGIYCYPVKELWEDYLERDLDILTTDSSLESVIPFAGDASYAIIFRSPSEGILDNHTDKDFAPDLIDVATKYFPDVDGLPERINKLAIEAEERAHVKTHLGVFWYLSYELSRYLAYRTKRQKNTRIWNFLMRKLGVTGIVDRGQGIIHYNEPTQAVFFSTESLKVIKVVPNKLHASDGTGMINKTVMRYFDQMFCPLATTRAQKTEMVKERFLEYLKGYPESPSFTDVINSFTAMVQKSYPGLSSNSTKIFAAVQLWIRKYQPHIYDILERVQADFNKNLPDEPIIKFS